jgi:hypothetical protein
MKAVGQPAACRAVPVEAGKYAIVDEGDDYEKAGRRPWILLLEPGNTCALEVAPKFQAREIF